MTRDIDLEEYARCGPYRLSGSERDALKGQLPSLTIEPVAGKEGDYSLTPGSTVGTLEVGDLSVFIRPKIGIPQLLSLVCYAMSRLKLRRELFDYPREYALPDVLALALASAARRAFSRGLLHGYRTEEEALHTVRGRIRVGDQMRRKFEMVPPVEVRYDEFTEDILANRLVKAATYRLAGLRLRWRASRTGLGWVSEMLGNVSLVEFPPNSVPDVRFDRLNGHYGEVVALSRLILHHGAFQSGRGEVRASGFLLDMNSVFQEFVTQAMREALGVSGRVFREGAIPSLDQGGRAGLRPDLTWWEGSYCTFVGDAKYKNLTGNSVPGADLYQLLAYVTALNLPGGLLVYAMSKTEQGTYIVRHAGKRLKVAALDLSGTLDDALVRVRDLAGTVKALRDEARAMRPAA